MTLIWLCSVLIIASHSCRESAVHIVSSDPIVTTCIEEEPLSYYWLVCYLRPMRPMRFLRLCSSCVLSAVLFSVHRHVS